MKSELNESNLPYEPVAGERVEFDVGDKIGTGLYVTWLPKPEIQDCHWQVVSEEYGLLVFDDVAKLRPAKTTVQSFDAPKCYDLGPCENCETGRIYGKCENGCAPYPQARAHCVCEPGDPCKFHGETFGASQQANGDTAERIRKFVDRTSTRHYIGMRAIFDHNAGMPRLEQVPAIAIADLLAELDK